MTISYNFLLKKPEYEGILNKGGNVTLTRIGRYGF